MTPITQIAPGERIYAIGDVHGCADLFGELLSMVREDNASRAPMKTRVIVLGDVIDRGPDSAAVVERLMKYTRHKRFIVLKGNHEDTMLVALSGDLRAARAWMEFGGAAALESWGLPPEVVQAGDIVEIMRQARRYIPGNVVSWMDRLRLSYRSGGVLFVHAGVRPGVPLAKQNDADLLWIRKDFVEDESSHPLFIVHGHTIEDDSPNIKMNRIGIDTGAYRTGRLTALGMEGNRFWSLSTPCNAKRPGSTLPSEDAARATLI